MDFHTTVSDQEITFMATKKAAKKTAKKAVGKTVTKKDVPDKFSIVDDLYESILEIAEVTSRGEIRLKKTELKKSLESSFELAALAAARGQRVKLPFVGTISRKDVPARKAGKGVNPFTGEAIQISARPASMKPRFTFPKAMKDLFAEKKNWK